MQIPYSYSKGRGPFILIFYVPLLHGLLARAVVSITNKNCSFLTEPSSLVSAGAFRFWLLHDCRPLLFRKMLPWRGLGGRQGPPPTLQAKKTVLFQMHRGEVTGCLRATRPNSLILANLTPSHQTLNLDTRSVVRGGYESSCGTLDGLVAMLPKTCSSLTYIDRSKNIYFFIFGIWSHKKANTFFFFSSLS